MFSINLYPLILVFPLLAIFTFPSTSFSSPAESEDFGVWSTFDLEKKINAKWKIKAGEEIRFREALGLRYMGTYTSTEYKVWDFFALGCEYEQVRASRTAQTKEKWYWESNYRIYAMPQILIKGFLLEDRNALEIEWRENSKTDYKYRNRIGITAPWKWTRLEFQPYSTNEFFWETDRKGIIEDRLCVGFKMHWGGPVYGAVFYSRQSVKNLKDKWIETNILGTSLKVVF